MKDRHRAENRSKAMKQPGFMIYAEDWEIYTEEYTDEEMGKMLRALLSYFNTREQPSFPDRGMRHFFKMVSGSIDRDIRRYTDKCRQNAYNRYKGVCRQQHEKPLSFEEWITGIDDRRQTSPTQTVTETQTETETVTQTEAQTETQAPSRNASMGQSFDAAAPRPLSPEEFEKRREQAIASLRTPGPRL